MKVFNITTVCIACTKAKKDISRPKPRPTPKSRPRPRSWPRPRFKKSMILRLSNISE